MKKGVLAALVLGLAANSAQAVLYNPSAYDAKLIVPIALDDLFIPVPVTFQPVGSCHNVSEADFNGDGVNDLFLQGCMSGDTSYILLGRRNSAGTIEYRSISQSWTNSYLGLQWTGDLSNIYINDYNGDGRPDIILESRATGGTSAMLYSDAGGRFAQVENTWQNTVTTPAFTSLATVAGATPGAFSVSSTGAATYTIPIVVPPGTSGMAPSLSLNYNSQGGNGLLGVGWSLGGLSAIHHCPMTIAQDGSTGGINFDANDHYCLDGQRLIAVGNYDGGTEYRTEIETFSRIVGYSTQGTGHAYFKVWTKSGQRMEYGVTANARIETTVPNNPSVRVWALNKVQDTVGNYLTIAYYENPTTGEYYPTRINYTMNGSAGLVSGHHVEFVYGARSDATTAYVAGSMVKSSVLLSNVRTYVDAAGISSLVKDYRLSYVQGQTSSRSRLAQVQECSANSCLPATSLIWSDGTAPSTGFASAWSVGSSHLPNDQMGDVDGDGRADIVKFDAGTAYVWLAKNNFSGPATWATGLGASFYDQQVLADVDGDGKADVINVLGGTHTASVWLSNGNNGFVSQGNTGSGFTAAADGIQVGDFNGDGRMDVALGYQKCPINALTCPANPATVWLSTGTGYGAPFWSAPVASAAYGLLVGDIDGDGRSDLIVKSTASSFTAYKATGTGFTAIGSWACHGACGLYIADVNGDGYADVVELAGSNYYAWLSTGRGFIDQGTSVAAFGAKPKFADLNGDGKSDLLEIDSSGNAQVRYSTGSGFGAAVNWGIGHNADEQLADMDGDGRPDAVYFAADGTSKEWLGGGTAPYSDLLISIKTGLDVQTMVTYHSLAKTNNYTKGTTAIYPAMDFQRPFYVVIAHNVSDGIGGINATSYTYTGARVDQRGRGWLGFESMTITGQDGNKTTTSYSQTFPNVGLIFQKYLTTSGGSLLRITTNFWNSLNLGGGRYLPYLWYSTEGAWEINGMALPTVTTTNGYDAYGNLTSVKVETSGNTTTTVNSYDPPDITNWLVASLNQAQVTTTLANASSTSRTTTFEHYLGTGLLKSETIEPNNAALWLKSAYAYDAFGNKTSVTVTGPDITSRSTTTAYGPDGAYPYMIINPLGQAEFRGYDARFGAMSTLTGPNGLLTRWYYDDLGRKSQENRADGTMTTWTYSACGFCNANESYFVTESSSGAAPVMTYFDKLNRKSRVGTTSLEGRTVYQKTEYDALGRTARESRPYFDGATPSWATYGYDQLGRVIDVTAPDGVITHTTYSGLQTTIYASYNNPNQEITTRWKNALGQLERVQDASLGNTYYQYDPLGNLIKVTDAAGNISTMFYDIRGRKIAMDDPDMGHWEYQYNALGELIKQWDAKTGRNTTLTNPVNAAAAPTTTMTYDLLGRMTARTEAEGTSTWTYDTAPGAGIGKLAREDLPVENYSQVMTYDLLGRATGITATVGGEVLTQTTAYDGNGRVSQITYPTGFAVKQVYNANGYLSEVRDAASNALYWQANTAKADGQLETETLGNTVVTTHDYDALGRVASIRSGIGSAANVQNLSYVYDSLGNLTTRNDYNRANIAETFTYDELNRVKTDTLGTLAKTYSYDAIGNIIKKDDFSASSVSSGNPYTYTGGTCGGGVHAVKSVALKAGGTITYCYDANGNMTNDPAHTFDYAYTSSNMPANHQKGASFSTFHYGPDRNRIVQTSSTGTTYYLNTRVVGGVHYDMYEKEYTGGIIVNKHYIYGGSGLIAVYASRSNNVNDTRYVHKDHLGSIDSITNESGAVVERLSYDPWGKRRNPDGTDDTANTLQGVNTHHGYTGHEHIDTVGLIHMNGRVYEPTLGRFLSADPTVNYPAGTQGFNRYSYVENNPLSRVDMDGYNWISDRWHAAWNSEVGRIAITVAASWATYGAVSSFLTSGTGVAGLTTQTSIMLDANTILVQPTLNIAGAAVAGGAAGFSAGLVGSGGQIKPAIQGGISGAISGGISGYYGSTYPIERVAANAMAGGTSSVIRGGRFEDGFMDELRWSSLTYANVQMRRYQVALSLKDPEGRSDGTGWSKGLFGDSFKLAGGRFDPNNPGSCSSLGCQQKGHGSIFGFSYSFGSFSDMALESYAGPHDMANMPLFYNDQGYIRSLTSAQEFAGEWFGNYTTSLMFATPFAAAAIREQTYYSSYIDSIK